MIPGTSRYQDRWKRFLAAPPELPKSSGTSEKANNLSFEPEMLQNISGTNQCAPYIISFCALLGEEFPISSFLGHLERKVPQMLLSFPHEVQAAALVEHACAPWYISASLVFPFSGFKGLLKGFSTALAFRRPEETENKK